MPSPSPGPVALALPLAHKPVLKQVGLNVHGARRKERYVMDNLWSLHVYWWRGALTVGGRTFTISPGCASVEPPNTPLIWRYDDEQCPHYYAHFELRSGGRLTPMPIVQQTGAAFAEVCTEMETLMGLCTAHRLRAEVRLWDLLLRLATPEAAGASGANGLPFAVQTAVAIIENELREAPRVASIAKRVGISHNQLTRLFNDSFGCGVAGYIRKRRLEKARHLLRRSTLPIKAIAKEVGMPSLQQFNKFVRQQMGVAPRDVRAGTTP